MLITVALRYNTEAASQRKLRCFKRYLINSTHVKSKILVNNNEPNNKSCDEET